MLPYRSPRRRTRSRAPRSQGRDASRRRELLGHMAQAFMLGGIVALVVVVGQAKSSSEAFPVEPVAAMVDSPHAHPQALLHPPSQTPTDRELMRLCRGWSDSRSRSANASSASWQRQWHSGWSGPLGEVAAQSNLTFEWRCHVDGFNATEGYRCLPQPHATNAWYLNPLPWTARQVRGEVVAARGDILQLRGLRRALTEEDGVVFGIGENCRISVILDDVTLIERRAETPPPPDVPAAIPHAPTLPETP